jgi:hypothetical protein
MKNLIIIILTVLSINIYAKDFNIMDFSRPDKYGWNTFEKRQKAVNDLANRQKLLQLYEMEKQDIVGNVMKSVIIPGWGQYHAKDYSKGQVFLGLETVMLLTSYYLYEQSMNKYDRYKHATQIDEIHRLYNDASRPYRFAQTFFGAYLAILVYNCYDSIDTTNKYNAKIWEKIEKKSLDISITPTGLTLRF